MRSVCKGSKRCLTAETRRIRGPTSPTCNVFHAPGRGDRSVLVLNINPDASALESSFDPIASYELNIDTDGDLE